MTTLAFHEPLTPLGKLVKVAPVAPVVVYAIVFIAEFTHVSCEFVPAPDDNTMVFAGITVMVAVADLLPQIPPFVVIV